MRAAIYCRISRDRTGEQAGVGRQMEDCRRLAADLGWTVVEEYVDNDISATSGKVRPEYRRLLSAIKAREIGAVVVWHPDRLYRKLTDLEALIEVVEGNNVIVRPVQAGEVDLSTASGRGIARILGVVATMEGEQKSERWRRSIRQRREQGQAPGWGPRLFGYTREGEVISAERDAIRDVANALIEGASIRQLAHKLTRDGHTSTLGNPWSTQALTQLMQNPRLAGHSTLNGDTVGVGGWQPILTQEAWEQVQSAFAVRRGSALPRPRVALLVGVVRCGLCGTALISGRLGKSHGKRRIYRCPTPPRAEGCGRIAIGAEQTEEVVEAYARARLSNPAVRKRVEELATSAGESIAEVIALEARKGELEAQLDEPGIPVETILRAIDRTKERIERLRTTAPPSARLPREGQWPEDLARRARLIRLVVEVASVHPAERRGAPFDPTRIKIRER